MYFRLWKYRCTSPFARFRSLSICQCPSLSISVSLSTRLSACLSCFCLFCSRSASFISCSPTRMPVCISICLLPSKTVHNVISFIPPFQLDTEEVRYEEVLAECIRKGADLLGDKDGPKCKWPLLRLCRIRDDGDSLLKLVDLQNVHPDYKNRMFEEAIKRGSDRTVQVGISSHIIEV